MNDEQADVTPKARILIVEADTLTAMMMVNSLTRAGCDVSAVHTGKKGLKLARENKFNLIVLAVGLPDINGFDIASELRQRHVSRRTPIVFINAQPSEEQRQHAFEMDAADYIVKPFALSDFVRRILAHANDKSETDEAIQTATT